MLREDIGWIRSVCQHRLDTQLEESREVLRVFFGMDEDEIEVFSILLDWVAGHGLERFFTQKDHIEELRDRLYGDTPSFERR